MDSCAIAWCSLTTGLLFWKKAQHHPKLTCACVVPVSSIITILRYRLRGSLQPTAAGFAPKRTRAQLATSQLQARSQATTASSGTMAEGTKTLEHLGFENGTLRALPIDPTLENHTRTVVGACFSKVQPVPAANPQTVAVSQPALDLLDISPNEVRRLVRCYSPGFMCLTGSVVLACRGVRRDDDLGPSQSWLYFRAVRSS